MKSKETYSVAYIAGILCSIGILIAFLLLPWRGSRTGSMWLQRETLLILIPVAAFAGGLISLRRVFKPASDRKSAFGLLVAGMIGITYYIIPLITQFLDENMFRFYDSLNYGGWVALFGILGLVGVAGSIVLFQPTDVKKLNESHDARFNKRNVNLENILSFFGLVSPPDTEQMKAKGDINGLIKTLKFEKRDGIRRHAAIMLGAIGDTQAIESLIQALKDESRDVRSSAVGALGAIGGSRTVEPLIQALKDKSDDVRKQAAESLSRPGVRDERVVEPLIRALDDYFVADAAAESLGRLGPLAIEPLVSALNDATWFGRSKSAEALQKLGWKPTTTSEHALLAIAQKNWDDVVSLGEVAVQPLAGCLIDSSGGSVKLPPSDVIEKIVEILEQLQDERAIVALASIVNQKKLDFRIRDKTAIALINLGWTPQTDSEQAVIAISNKSWVEAVRLGERENAVKMLLEVATSTYNKGEAHSAIRSLEKVLEHNVYIFSNYDLRRIVNLQGVQEFVGYEDVNCSFGIQQREVYKPMDVSHLRQLARQELIRRGEEA